MAAPLSEDLQLKVEQLTEKIAAQDAKLAELHQEDRPKKEEGAEAEEGVPAVTINSSRRELGARSGKYVIVNECRSSTKMLVWVDLAAASPSVPRLPRSLGALGRARPRRLRRRTDERYARSSSRKEAPGSDTRLGVLLEAVDGDGLLREKVAAGSPNGALDYISISGTLRSASVIKSFGRAGTGLSTRGDGRNP